MSGAKSTVAERIKRIKEMRERVSGRRLTAEERVELLNEVYDTALLYLVEHTLHGSFKSSGAITYQLERARLEIESIAPAAAASKDRNYTVDFELPGLSKQNAPCDA